MIIRKLISRIISVFLGRPFEFDESVPLGTVLYRSFTVGFGLLRGLLIVRKRIFLGRGARIRSASLLETSGGLVRIEEFCHVDCRSKEGISLGRNFKLGAFSRMVASGTLENIGKGIRIGNNVGIGEFAHIGGSGGVVIGDDCIIGAYLSIHPENHIFTDPDTLIRDQGVTREGIAIGRGCWIGAKVTILDGVRIGNGCVIAAGSVVRTSFPDHSVIAGVPARLLRKIGSEVNEG